MKFTVGPLMYSVKVTEGPILAEGEHCLGFCSPGTRELKLSRDCPPLDRFNTLCHELAHAWIFATGRPADVEGWCDLIGTMMRSTIRDLSMQGGEEALIRLRPGESPQRAACRIGLLTARECGRCRSQIAGGSVVCLPSPLPGFLELALYCDGCGHVQRWQEMATASGLPSGTLKGDPTFERGESVKTFIHDYPNAAPGDVFTAEF